MRVGGFLPDKSGVPFRPVRANKFISAGEKFVEPLRPRPVVAGTLRGNRVRMHPLVCPLWKIICGMEANRLTISHGGKGG